MLVERSSLLARPRASLTTVLSRGITPGGHLRSPTGHLPLTEPVLSATEQGGRQCFGFTGFLASGCYQGSWTSSSSLPREPAKMQAPACPVLQSQTRAGPRSCLYKPPADLAARSPLRTTVSYPGGVICGFSMSDA